MFIGFDLQELVSAFIVLFAVIDIIGSIPIIINLKQRGKGVNAMKATVISFLLLLGFFYAGDMMLKLFHVDIASFAVAGAFVIFLMSLEMLLDVRFSRIKDLLKKQHWCRWFFLCWLGPVHLQLFCHFGPSMLALISFWL